MGATGGAESVVSQGEDGEMLVNVQVPVAANTDVPAAPITGKAEHRPVPLVEPLRLLVHLDVGPYIVESRGHDDGPGLEADVLARTFAAERLDRRFQRKQRRLDVECLEPEHVAGPVLDTGAPGATADCHLAHRAAGHPLAQCPHEVAADDPLENGRILDLHRLRPKGAPLEVADRPGIEHEHVTGLVGGRDRGLRPGRPGADDGHVVDGAVLARGCHRAASPHLSCGDCTCDSDLHAGSWS